MDSGTVVLWLSGRAILIVEGVSILPGFRARTAATLLGGFLLLSAVLRHIPANVMAHVTKLGDGSMPSRLSHWQDVRWWWRGRLLVSRSRDGLRGDQMDDLLEADLWPRVISASSEQSQSGCGKFRAKRGARARIFQEAHTEFARFV